MTSLAVAQPLSVRNFPARDDAPLVNRRSGIYAMRTTTSTVEPVTSLHTEVELVLVLSGRLRYFVAGHSVTARPGRLRIFWGGLPHRAVEVQPFTELLGMHIPL